jgi:pimeloyl-ACP methyl ester carboxylesterase
VNINNLKVGDRVVIAVHGAWFPSEFPFLENYLKEMGIQLIALDLLDFGIPRHKERLDNYIQAIRHTVWAVYKRTAMRPYLLGHSFGGRMILEYVADEGEDANKKIAGIICLNSLPPSSLLLMMSGTILNHIELIPLMLQIDMRAPLKSFDRFVRLFWSQRMLQKEEQFLRDLYGRMNTVSRRLFFDVILRDIDLSHYKGPVLVLEALDDMMVPVGTGKTILRSFPNHGNARRVTVSGPHNNYEDLQGREIVAGEVASFIGS